MVGTPRARLSTYNVTSLVPSASPSSNGAIAGMIRSTPSSVTGTTARGGTRERPAACSAKARASASMSARGSSSASTSARPRMSMLGLALDHALERELHHGLPALIEHAVLVGDDAAVGLLRLALVDDLDLDADRVARQ